MRKISVIVIAMLILLACNPVFSQDEDLTGVLQGVVEKNFSGCVNEDYDEMMDAIHTLAPGYMQTLELSKQLFPYYDLKYELLDFNYIGKDAEYALARGKQRTTKITGPEFKDNIVDMIYIFKQEKGSWKIWTQAILESEIIGED